METYKNSEAHHFATRADWRGWLQKHGETSKAIWVIIYHKGSGTPSVTYQEVVLEALCFGWIDSVPNKRDAESSYQFLSPRKPKSKWSAVNKRHVANLEKEGLMAEPGRKMVELAKQTGTWDALNEVDTLAPPPDLLKALQDLPPALENWEAFPKSTLKGILEWISNAKTDDTRQKRIYETAWLAQVNKRANQFPKQTRE